jgi:hypothetical protein
MESQRCSPTDLARGESSATCGNSRATPSTTDVLPTPGLPVTRSSYIKRRFAAHSCAPTTTLEPGSSAGAILHCRRAQGARLRPSKKSPASDPVALRTAQKAIGLGMADGRRSLTCLIHFAVARAWVQHRRLEKYRRPVVNPHRGAGALP